MGIVCSDHREESPTAYDPRLVMYKRDGCRDGSPTGRIFREHWGSLSSKEKVSQSWEHETWEVGNRGLLQPSPKGNEMPTHVLLEEKRESQVDARGSFPESKEESTSLVRESFPNLKEELSTSPAQDNALSDGPEEPPVEAPKEDKKDIFINKALNEESSDSSESELRFVASKPFDKKDSCDEKGWLQPTSEGNKMLIDVLNDERKQLQMEARESYCNLKPEHCSSADIDNRRWDGPGKLPVDAPNKWKDIWDNQGWLPPIAKVNEWPRDVLFEQRQQKKEPNTTSYDLQEDTNTSQTRADRVRSGSTAPAIEVPQDDSANGSVSSSYYTTDGEEVILDSEFQFPALGSEKSGVSRRKSPQLTSTTPTPPWVINSQYSTSTFNLVAKPTFKVPPMYKTRSQKRDAKDKESCNFDTLTPYGSQMESTPESDISHLEGLPPTINAYPSNNKSPTDFFLFANSASNKGQRGSFFSNSGILIADVPVNVKASPLGSGTDGFFINHLIEKAK